MKRSGKRAHVRGSELAALMEGVRRSKAHEIIGLDPNGFDRADRSERRVPRKVDRLVAKASFGAGLKKTSKSNIALIRNRGTKRAPASGRLNARRKAMRRSQQQGT